MAEKQVYFFGSGKAEGSAKMKELLGGKGANLAEIKNYDMTIRLFGADTRKGGLTCRA